GLPIGFADQRHVDKGHPLRRRGCERIRELLQLAWAPQVNHGPNPVGNERRDSGESELVEIVGAHDPTPRRLSRRRAKTTKVARIEKVRPNEVSIHGTSALT